MPGPANRCLMMAIASCLLLACGLSETAISDLSSNADTLVLAGQVDEFVVTNPDTAFSPPDTVILVRVDTLVLTPDSLVVTVVDTVVSGVDTTFLTRTDTLVTIDTIVASTVDTVIRVDTVVVGDTIYLTNRLVASRGSLTLDSGRTATLTATAQDPLGRATVPSSIIWLSDAPGIASVNTAGTVRGERPGSANIFGIASGLSTSVPTTVRRVEAPPPLPPPPPSGPVNGRYFRAHEPTGMTSFTSRPFSALREGWTGEFDGNPESIVTSGYGGTPPMTAPSVLRARFDAGGPGGGPWGNIGVHAFPRTVTTLYIHVAFQLSTNWQNHNSGTSKVFYVRHPGNPNGRPGWNTFFGARGTAYGSLQIGLYGQDHVNGAPILTANAGSSGSLTRGQWYEIEFLLIGSTPGQLDGILRVWKNGVLTHDYDDMGYTLAGLPEGFSALEIYPVWGGVGDVRAETQYMYFDHFYISGK